MSYYIPDMLHRPGALVEGRYRLIAMVSRGRLSVVYRGKDERYLKDVAVKIVPGVAAAVDANRVGRVRHASVIEIVDVAPVGPEHTAIVMEWVDGTQLGTVLKAGPLGDGQGLAIFEQLAAAVEAAHAQRVTHGVIQPNNVVLSHDEDGALVARLAGLDRLIVAFPLAEVTEPPEGSPSYDAPELHRSPIAAPAGDIYSLGATMWHALTGQPQRVVPSVGRASIRVPNTVELPANVRAILDRCMRLKPEDRYPSATALLADLRALREPPAGAWLHSPWLRLLATGGLVAVGVILLTYLAIVLYQAGVFWQSEPESVPPALVEADLVRPAPPAPVVPPYAPPLLVDGQDELGLGEPISAGSDAAEPSSAADVVPAPVPVAGGGEPPVASGGGAGDVTLDIPASTPSGQGAPVAGSTARTEPAGGPSADGQAADPATPADAVAVVEAETLPVSSSPGTADPVSAADPGSAADAVSGADPGSAADPASGTAAATPAAASAPAGPLSTLAGTTRWSGELGGRPAQWTLQIASSGRIVGTSRTRFGADWVVRTLSGRATEEGDRLTINVAEVGGNSGASLVGSMNADGGVGSLQINGRQRAAWSMRRQ